MKYHDHFPPVRLPTVEVPVPTAPLLSTVDALSIRPWPDPVLDTVGLDPRSIYVERFYLSILGPSTTFLVRRLAAGLEAQPAGFVLDLISTAEALGLRHQGGRNSPFVRALTRICQFELAYCEDDALHVRRKLPPLARRQVDRLPEPLRAEHARWQRDQLDIPTEEHQRRRARQLALSLFELGEDVEGVERQLHRWRVHPALAIEARAWAWARHRDASGDDDAS
jgi:hypothetical protein